MIRLTEDYPEGNTQLYVDDTSMHAVGDSIQDVIDSLLPVMRFFKHIVRKLKLRLSPKAVIVQ